MDRLSSERRSALMRKVCSKNTGPEMIVRSLTHSMGYRFRLHRRDLPGTPDLAFIKKKKAIFVHGCFWHRHNCRAGRSQPSSNIAFWQAKFERNVLRDRRNIRALRYRGWKALIVWECQLKELWKVEARIERFLSPSQKSIRR